MRRSEREIIDRGEIEAIIRECDFSLRYRSVIGEGVARIVTDAEEKRKGLELIMAHYSDRSHEFRTAAVAKTTVVRIEFETLTGKRAR